MTSHASVQLPAAVPPTATRSGAQHYQVRDKHKTSMLKLTSYGGRAGLSRTQQQVEAELIVLCKAKELWRGGLVCVVH